MIRLTVNFKVLLLVLFFPLFYGWFRYVPSLTWTFNIILFFIIFLFIFFYRGISFKTFNNLKNYVFFMLIFIPILGSISAFYTYGQPIFYGLASYRYLILLLFVLILTQQLIKGRFKIKHLESGFIFLAWFSLFIFSFLALFFNPNNLIADDFGNWVILGPNGNNFNFPKGFIIFGLLYYFCMSINPHQRSKLNTISFIIFLTYLLLGSISRMLFLSLFIAIVFLTLNFNRVNLAMKFRNIIRFCALLIFVFTIIAIIDPGYFLAFFLKYSDAFLAITGVSEVEDWSANSRIQQFLIVLPLISENIMFGTGALSNQWMGGYEGVYGYLHPSDLGLIGILFQVGLVGVSFLLIQYFFAFSVIRKFLRVGEKTEFREFYMTMIATLITNCIASVTTGSILYGPETILFLIFILKFATLPRNL